MTQVRFRLDWGTMRRPADIIEQIQKYVDGESIYIPRAQENQRSWGEKSGTKKALEIRNRKIYEDFLNGALVELLAETYFLTHKSIRRVIRQERKKPHHERK